MSANTKTERNAALVEHYRNSQNMRVTAKAFGLSLERVRQILRRDAPEIIRPHGGVSGPRNRG